MSGEAARRLILILELRTEMDENAQPLLHAAGKFWFLTTPKKDVLL